MKRDFTKNGETTTGRLFISQKLGKHFFGVRIFHLFLQYFFTRVKVSDSSDFYKSSNRLKSALSVLLFEENYHFSTHSPTVKNAR